MLTRSGSRPIATPEGLEAGHVESTAPSILSRSHRLRLADGPDDGDRVLATVAFTDIVDSTACAARLGDRRWSEILGQHDTIVRRELAHARGQEIKTTGDGFLVAFGTPSRAVRWAAAVARAVAALGVDVRAGVHTGECVRVDGDLIGIALHICARICSLAGPHEVLVSGTVKELTTGSELTFGDRGVQPLRGIADPWRVYALLERRADVLDIRTPRVFPPLKAL